MQIKPYDGTSVNQHGICSTKVFLRPRVISKALQIRNFKSASLLVVKNVTLCHAPEVTYPAPTRSFQKIFSLKLSHVRQMAILVSATTAAYTNNTRVKQLELF
jgi:hypothetical protein